MEFTIKFIGICTHLVPNNPTMPFQLTAGADKKIDIAHRVVIPNSDLIKDHIDPKRCVPPHIPKLIIPNQAMGDDGLDLAMVARGDGNYELVLDQLEIGFSGVSDDPGIPPYHWEALRDLPHITCKNKSGNRNPRLHDVVRLGWDDHASAYIDFTNGVTFKVEGPKNDPIVIATLRTGAKPYIVFRPRNGNDKTEYRLRETKHPIIVSNVPVADCGNSDYLLHYLITTISVHEDAPIWKPPTPKPGEGYGAGTEVYCSSSTFP